MSLIDGGLKKPPIPMPTPNGIGNITIKKSNSLIRGDKEITQFQINKVVQDMHMQDAIIATQRTPRYNTSANLNRNTSNNTLNNKISSNSNSSVSSSSYGVVKKKSIVSSDSENSLASGTLSHSVSKDSHLSVISPSGLLTDGPMNRKSSISPLRKDRSMSPLVDNKIKPLITTRPSVPNINNTLLNTVSNKTVQNAIKPSNIPSPTAARKQQPARRSLLPQPLNVTRRTSMSPQR